MFDTVPTDEHNTTNLIARGSALAHGVLAALPASSASVARFRMRVPARNKRKVR